MNPGVLADAQILWCLLRGKPAGGSHAENLQAFYGPQAAGYDAFRARLLHGRKEMLAALDIQAGDSVVELGCGTGNSLDFLAEDQVETLNSLTLVDLCPALLDRARERAASRSNVMVAEGDASNWRPPGKVDRVFLSYSLTMMPNWPGVIRNVKQMLKPGGRVGIVDFYLATGSRGIEALFWKRWFAHDGVELSPDRLRELRWQFPRHACVEMRGTVPYLPGFRVPYFVFVGTRA